MYHVKNISGGLLVCTLADKETTLRVKNKETVDVPDNQMTPYLHTAETKKLVKLSHTPDKKTTPTAQSEKKEG